MAECRAEHCTAEYLFPFSRAGLKDSTKRYEYQMGIAVSSSSRSFFYSFLDIPVSQEYILLFYAIKEGISCECAKFL
jgi:hypothetical protein